MPAAKKTRRARSSREQPPGRYDIRKIGQEIESVRVKLGIPVKRIAADAEIDQFAWYKKVACDGNEFGIAEIGRIAELPYINAPLCWPWVDWATAQRLTLRSNGR